MPHYCVVSLSEAIPPHALFLPLKDCRCSVVVTNCCRGRIRTADLRTNATLFNQLSCTAYHICFIWIKAHAGAQPCLRYLVIRSWTNSEPRSICTFCLNSAFLRLIRLSFSPTLPSALHYYLSLCLLHLAQLVSIWIRNLPCRLWLYLRIGYRLFHSVGLSVSFDAVSIRYTYRLAPWLLYLLSDLNK